VSVTATFSTEEGGEEVLVSKALLRTAEVTKTIWFNLECVLQRSGTLKQHHHQHDVASTFFLTRHFAPCYCNCKSKNQTRGIYTWLLWKAYSV